MRVSAWLIAASLSVCHAQLSSTVSLNNGVRLQISANLGQPTGQQEMTVEMARASGDSFYRIFWDQNHLAVYAYELEVTLTPDGKAVQATVKPATAEFGSRYPNADAGKPTPTLSSTASVGPLTSGQSGKLELFEIPGMGLKISETIHVEMDDKEPRGAALRFTGLRVAVDGAMIAGPSTGAAGGRYAMFYIPGRGAFFFSMEPVEGRAFAKTGIVDKNRMSFTVDNVTYECLASLPIHGDTGEVWVLHDASYRPAGNWTRDPQQGDREQFFVGGSDSLGWWLQ